MENNNVIQQLDEKEQETIEGVPVCGANFVSPVTHTTNFIEEFVTKSEQDSISKRQTKDKGKE